MTYDSSRIKVLKGLEPAQKRPGMYTDTSNPNHLSFEVIDNSVDEYLAGHASQISVTLHADGYLSVADNGRGMPVDMHPEEGRSGVEVILDTLHSGGKFSDDNYAVSGGLHGVGVAVVNALSEHLIVQIRRNGFLYEIEYRDGVRQYPLRKVPGVRFEKSDTGTLVKFKPNQVAGYFDHPQFVSGPIEDLLHGKAMLCAKLKISFAHEEKSILREFYYEDGVVAFLNEHELASQAVGDFFFCGDAERDLKEVKAAELKPMFLSWGCFWHPERAALAKSFVNMIPTASHGTHVNAFRQGIFDGVMEAAEHSSAFPKGLNVTVDDVMRAFNFVISLKLPQPKFDGQTKGRLTSRECMSFINKIAKDRLSLFLSANINSAQALYHQIIQHAIERNKNAKMVERKAIGKLTPLPGKLADCKTTNRDDAELFIVEGDSAGGSAKQAKDNATQAILPLRGKFLNTWGRDAEKGAESQEVQDIAAAIGVPLGSTDFSGLRYGKICILADADADGSHIALLFVTLFFRHYRRLIELGHVYVAMPPLYRINIGKQVFYALDDDEKEKILHSKTALKSKSECKIQRFKGLGEMNPDQLYETTLAPGTRRLVQLTIEDEALCISNFDLLMDKRRVNERLTWISRHVNLTGVSD